jgi:cytochrome c553
MMEKLMNPNGYLFALLTLLVTAGWASIASGDGETRSPVSTDGAILFGSRCAHCHGSGVIQPDVKGLSKLKTEEIYHTLWSGIMREAANGLDDAQRRSIAEYVASLNPNKPSEKISGYCGKDAPAAGPPVSGTWSGWAPSPDNSRYLEHISISKSQAQKARLKWAFVFPDTGATTNAGNQPTVVDGRLYIGHRNKYVYSLDAGTGCVHWVSWPCSVTTKTMSTRWKPCPAGWSGLTVRMSNHRPG